MTTQCKRSMTMWLGTPCPAARAVLLLLETLLGVRAFHSLELECLTNAQGQGTVVENPSLPWVPRAVEQP